MTAQVRTDGVDLASREPQRIPVEVQFAPTKPQ